MNSLFSLIIALGIIGLALYLINLIPMEGTIKKILNIVVIVVVVLWLLSALFGGAGFPAIRLPQ